MPPSGTTAVVHSALQQYNQICDILKFDLKKEVTKKKQLFLLSFISLMIFRVTGGL